MTMWEYQIRDIYCAESDLVSILNEEGSCSWEALSIEEKVYQDVMLRSNSSDREKHFTVCFKRVKR